MTDQEIRDRYSPKELLLLVLHGMEIGILRQQGQLLEVEKGYSIEVEGPSLYKLLQQGRVIAPFSDVVELCEFIKMSPDGA